MTALLKNSHLAAAGGSSDARESEVTLLRE
jgi:hypothetical protein